MTEILTPEQASARLEPDDTLGIPLGPGQPAALLEALGEREDWDGLRIYGALLFVFSPVFEHPKVHYLSGFFGPVERMLRDKGANISFAPADFRRFARLLAEQHPRVMATAAAAPFDDGWCSLSLHAGAQVAALERAGADPERLLVVEASDRFPRTAGLPPEYRHALHVDQIDILIESDREPFAVEDPPPSDADRAIADHASRFVPEGATLQTGIGAIPSRIAGLLAEGDGGDYGVHSEMFTTGLMQLHEAGKISNRKGQFDGVSVATFAAGTPRLYEWLDGNEDVAFLPVEVVNSPDLIGRNRLMTTINGAISIDIQGQVIADAIDGNQYSGIGGHEDFISGPALSLDAHALLCLPSTVTIGGELQSRIVPWFDAGAVITTPRHQVDVIVTEHGAAELQGKTVHQRGEALAAIAHPDFRDELLEAADRASGGQLTATARLGMVIGVIAPSAASRQIATALALGVVALGLAACGSDSEKTTSSGSGSASAPPAENGGPPTASAASLGKPLPLKYFSTPSRNIGCYLTTTAVRCDIRAHDWTAPPKPANCDVDWGGGLAASERRADIVCAGDTVLDPGAPVLAYNARARRGAITCASRVAGITCTARVSRHGFFLSRQTYRLF